MMIEEADKTTWRTGCFDPDVSEAAGPEAYGLDAYRLPGQHPLPLVPAPSTRSWIQATTDHFAGRCLPLLIANQAGWFVLNRHALWAIWNGHDDVSSLTIEHADADPPYLATSHFGYGILTWQIPFLFRTPPGFNLLVRGPANWPKDGIYPLEGIVESDWAVATFTMNWKITRPNAPITFDVGEPICMLVPQRRQDLERFQPSILDLESNAVLQDGYEAWCQSRQEFLYRLGDRHPIRSQAWQQHYFRGVAPGGQRAAEHQTRLHLRGFVDGTLPREEDPQT